ncbi:ATP-binding protein [Streptomyces sp. H27-D2]|uniref:ATP-binding protein n=1 Tax=Streptomyces sp. H27-D2 TaxID=3046304 RepID=UPI002DBA1B3B|nr:ATP-binding protein [Streptomyces sp. H27-D2]MEC4016579.1 ATP-binding protein [Streptomyces sp. H27-D2]
MKAPHTQAPVTVSTFTQRFSATLRGARLARLLAAHQLADWGVPYHCEAHDAVSLVVAELAANSVLHGHVTGRDFELHLVHTGDLVSVEVSDTHPALPERAALAPDDEHGRGLHLVQALAERWGVRDRVGPGKTVWAECLLNGAGQDV